MAGYNGYSSTSKYSVNFSGETIETTLTDKAAVADKWVREILSLYRNIPTVVGLDVEWKPNAIRGMIDNNKSATLQLCIDNKCLILQLFYMDSFPPSLKSFLMDANFTFVGVKVGDDIDKIKDDYGLDCNKRADLRDVAECRWPGRFINRPGLKTLAYEIAGLRMDKSSNVRWSKWDERVLTEPQVEYACIDAYASFRVGYILLSPPPLPSHTVH